MVERERGKPLIVPAITYGVGGVIGTAAMKEFSEGRIPSGALTALFGMFVIAAAHFYRTHDKKPILSTPNL